jgi:hypothetical protein
MSSASAMGGRMMSASSTAMASASPLPKTGGLPLLPLLSAAALVMMAGSGMVAARIVRRSY